MWEKKKYKKKLERFAKGCPFCKIISKELPANIIYENEKYLAFYDKSPRATIHLQVVCYFKLFI